MPKVVSYTPPWLSRPSPGASIFANSPSKNPGKSSDKLKREAQYTGPSRLLAKRGTEVFAVVDNEIRWSSLTRLKDHWRDHARPSTGSVGAGNSSKGSSDQGIIYRVLNVPVFEQIRQLIISPTGAFLAVIADRTVYIVVLPDPSHLTGTDSSPLRMKTYQLGPTTHVIPESPVVSGLWHPLGLHNNVGGCFVTVTADAAVRVWELDRNNNWSFDRPTLAIDLRKLVDGTTCFEDFTPSGFGRNKGFSADFFDMEVASACFAGSGNGQEDAWAPMTMWVAMKPGDVYALCPLLPSKWIAPATTVSSLSAEIIPKLEALEEDALEDEDQLTICRQQYEWLAEINGPGSLQNSVISDTGLELFVFSRPANTPATPRLQGPYRFDIDEMDDMDLCDIFVIPAKIDAEALMDSGEGALALQNRGEDELSVTVLCLSSGPGLVHVCLELDGVEGQWLPRPGRQNAFRTPLTDPSELLLVESLATMKGQHSSSDNWPTLTQDTHSRYGFYVTNKNNITFVSLSSWVQRLEAELQAEDTAGMGFRLQVLCQGSVSLRERILQVDESSVSKDSPAQLPSCLVYYDHDLGYLLLTYYDFQPYSAVMQTPEIPLPDISNLRLEQDGDAPRQVTVSPLRPPYQVPSIFYSDSPLEFFVDKHVPHRERHNLKEQVVLSAATLDLVAAAHRTLSSHTNALERAASDLFRRCERLQDEMRDQLQQLSNVAERIKGVSSEVDEDGKWKEGSRSGEALKQRLQKANTRQSELAERYEKLRSKVLMSGGRPLSEREKLWIAEVGRFSDSLEDPKQEVQEEVQADELRLSERLKAVQELASEMLSEAKSLPANVKSPVSAEPGSPASKANSHLRPARGLQESMVRDAHKRLDREAAIIQAVASSLERLNAELAL